MDSCDWIDDEGTWTTGCQNDFILIEDTPKENNMNFCPYCGRRLIEEPTNDHK